MSNSTKNPAVDIVPRKPAYGLHPSPLLVELFRKKPWQGQDPQKARVIFVGRDANYSAKISDHPFFEHILDYHKDGVAFWQRHGVHHPFLLKSYPFDKRLDGVKYHAMFAKMGLDSSMAPAVSFIELLDVPTLGTTGKDTENLFCKLLKKLHLEYLDDLLAGKSERLVFISPSVVTDLRKAAKLFKMFDWLKDARGLTPSIDRPWLIRNGTRIYLTYHLSGAQVHGQIAGMGELIRGM